MSKERLEEITHMVNTLDESSLVATLYGFEMDSKALISDFSFLLNHIENQQAEIDTLSMAHDAMHRKLSTYKESLPKDKHTLIKTIHSLNTELNFTEEALEGFDKAYEKEKEQNKRYREAIDSMRLHAHYPELIKQIYEALEGEE